MPATLRITCAHDAPKGLDWANDFNKGERHPAADIDGREYPLRWDSATELPVSVGTPHRMHAFFEVLGGLRWGGADLDIAELREGETVHLEYRVSLRDRYLNTAELRRID